MKVAAAPQPVPSVKPESVPAFPVVSVAVTAASVAIIAVPRAAAAIVVHTAISAEPRDPFLYSKVAAAHMLNHMKTSPAQDKCRSCQVFPSQA